MPTGRVEWLLMGLLSYSINKIVVVDGLPRTRSYGLNTIKSLPGRREPRIGSGVSRICIFPSIKSSQVRRTRVVPIQTREPLARFNFRFVTVHRMLLFQPAHLLLRPVSLFRRAWRTFAQRKGARRKLRAFLPCSP